MTIKKLSNFINFRVFNTYLINAISFFILTITPYYLISTRSAADIKTLGIFESTILLILATVTLGFVQDASRKIALYPKEWNIYFKRCQSSKFLLGVLIFSISFFLYFATKNPKFLLGIISLPISLMGEYAFYAKGRTIEAAKSQLIRNTIYCFILIFGALNKNIIFSYLIIFSSFLSFTIAGFYTSKKLKVTYFPPLKIENNKYLKEMVFVSLVVLVHENFRNVYILLFGSHLLDIDYVYFYEVFKIYMIAFIIKRSLIQVYLKEIISKRKSFKYDYYIFFALFLFNISLVIFSIIFRSFFPEATILESNVIRDTVILITCMSFFPTYYTKLFSLDNNKLLVIPLAIIFIILTLGITILNFYQLKINYYIYLLSILEISMSIIITSFNIRFIKNYV